MKNKLQDLPEYFFNLDFRKKLIKNYTGISDKTLESKLKKATQNLASDWQEESRTNQKGINDFYKTTDHYIYELEAWHVEDISKQAGIVTISSLAKNKTFLEYGCGIADTAIAAILVGAKEVYALDLPSKTLDYAKHRAKYFNLKKDINWIEAPDDVEDLYPPRNYFDLVSCEDVFEHVVNPEKHAKKIYDSLKPYGSLIFQTEFVHSDCHPMHLESNNKMNGLKWLKYLESIGFEIISPCHVRKK